MANPISRTAASILFLILVCSMPATAGDDKPTPGTTALWSIGKPDHNDAEFALAPAGWDQFLKTFPDDVVFITGRSDAATDWPFVQPAPVDAWGNSRRHAYIVYFGLAKRPAADCRLVVDLIDTHSHVPPKWRFDFNGHATEYQFPPGAGDASIYGQPAAGKQIHVEIPVPASSLKAGNNILTIESLSGSWAIYDAIRFEGPAGARAMPVTAETTIRQARSAGVLVKGPEERQIQPTSITIRHTGDPTDATIDADGLRVPLRLRTGIMHVSIPTPAVEQATTMAIHLRTGGSTLAQQTIRIEPVRRWTVYLLPQTHTDIGYTHVQTEVEKRQWENLELAVETARKTADYPEGSRFRWNVEVMWAVDSYLREAPPEKRQALIDAIKAGWVELDALYGNELTGLCRPEELVHLVECAARVARQCNVPLENAMISDVPGYTWGIVPILAQAGVKYFSIGPNAGDRIGRTLSEWGDRPFYWESPSGQEHVLCWMAGKGYSFFHRGSLDKIGTAPILDYLEQLRASGYPYDLVQMRYSVGGDNGPPEPALCDFVRDWNKVHVSPRFVIATTSEMCRELERRYGDKIPRVRGDFTPYWEDGAGSSARETAQNRTTADTLMQAETLFAMLRPDRFPGDAFRSAWRDVVLYNEHTWGAWNSISQPDAPFVRQQWEIKKAFADDAQRQATDLLRQALSSVEPPAGESVSIEVFNTTSWPRSSLVTVPAEGARAGDLVKDADGQVVASQRLSNGELVILAKDIPAFGAKRYRVSHGNAAYSSGCAKAEPRALSTAGLTLQINEENGTIKSLRSRTPDREWADASAPVALNDYRYMLGSDATGATTNEKPTITVLEHGPLVASLRVESTAPGCRGLTRDIVLVDGLDSVQIFDTVDKAPIREKEGVHFGFAFDVPDGVVRMNTAWAVIRPDVDQLPGACRNWFSVQRWVDISNAKYGVTWATLDAPLVEVGGLTADRIGSLSDPNAWMDHAIASQTLYSWVMNNHWHTNYRAEQEGPVTFRYVIRPHGAFDAAAAHRFGIECSQPLIARTAADSMPLPAPLFRLEPADAIVVTSVQPADKGRSCIVRLFNPTDLAARTTLRWPENIAKRIRRCDLFGTAGDEMKNSVELPPWGILTLKCEGVDNSATQTRASSGR